MGGNYTVKGLLRQYSLNVPLWVVIIGGWGKILNSILYYGSLIFAQCALNFANKVAARGFVNPSAAFSLEGTCVRSNVPFNT